MENAIEPEAKEPPALTMLRALIGESIYYTEVNTSGLLLGVSGILISPLPVWKYRYQKLRIKDESCPMEQRTHFELWRLVNCTITSVQADEVRDITLGFSDGSFLWFKGKGTTLEASL
jgi:hypothetical protein